LNSGPRHIRSNGHLLELRADDTFLVSYPKSGNTWLRFMLANLISRAPESFQDANNLVPDIHNERTPAILSQVASPRILKSHLPYDPNYPRVVYLVRDPRSVCVSQFWFKKRKGEVDPEQPFEDFFELFLDGFDDGFGDWGNHVTSWKTVNGDGKDRIELRFEDLKADTAVQLTRVSEFAALEPSPEQVEMAIANSSMKSMRKIEEDTDLGRHLEGIGDLTIPFVRRGSISEWREYFSRDMNSRIREKFGDGMEYFGYA